MERLAPIVMHALGWVQHRDGLDMDALQDLPHTELGELDQSMATSEDGQLRNLTESEADDEVLRRGALRSYGYRDRRPGGRAGAAEGMIRVATGGKRVRCNLFVIPVCDR